MSIASICQSHGPEYAIIFQQGKKTITYCAKCNPTIAALAAQALPKSQKLEAFPAFSLQAPEKKLQETCNRCFQKRLGASRWYLTNPANQKPTSLCPGCYYSIRYQTKKKLSSFRRLKEATY